MAFTPNEKRLDVYNLQVEIYNNQNLPMHEYVESFGNILRLINEEYSLLRQDDRIKKDSLINLKIHLYNISLKKIMDDFVADESDLVRLKDMMIQNLMKDVGYFTDNIHLKKCQDTMVALSNEIYDKQLHILEKECSNLEDDLETNTVEKIEIFLNKFERWNKRSQAVGIGEKRTARFEERVERLKMKAINIREIQKEIAAEKEDPYDKELQEQIKQEEFNRLDKTTLPEMYYDFRETLFDYIFSGEFLVKDNEVLENKLKDFVQQPRFSNKDDEDYEHNKIIWQRVKDLMDFKKSFLDSARNQNNIPEDSEKNKADFIFVFFDELLDKENYSMNAVLFVNDKLQELRNKKNVKTSNKLEAYQDNFKNNVFTRLFEERIKELHNTMETINVYSEEDGQIITHDKNKDKRQRLFNQEHYLMNRMKDVFETDAVYSNKFINIQKAFYLKQIEYLRESFKAAQVGIDRGSIISPEPLKLDLADYVGQLKMLYHYDNNFSELYKRAQSVKVDADRVLKNYNNAKSKLPKKRLKDKSVISRAQFLFRRLRARPRSLSLTKPTENIKKSESRSRSKSQEFLPQADMSKTVSKVTAKISQKVFDEFANASAWELYKKAANSRVHLAKNEKQEIISQGKTFEMQDESKVTITRNLKEETVVFSGIRPKGLSAPDQSLGELISDGINNLLSMQKKENPDALPLVVEVEDCTKFSDLIILIKNLREQHKNVTFKFGDSVKMLIASQLLSHKKSLEPVIYKLLKTGSQPQKATLTAPPSENPEPRRIEKPK